jgi:hypothetical protein
MLIQFSEAGIVLSPNFLLKRKKSTLALCLTRRFTY